MTKFETIGCNYQYDAPTLEAANKSFEISCNICCNNARALYCTCDNCAIKQCHEMVVAAFADEKRQ